MRHQEKMTVRSHGYTRSGWPRLRHSWTKQTEMENLLRIRENGELCCILLLIRFDCVSGPVLIISLRNRCTMWTLNQDFSRKHLKLSLGFWHTHFQQRMPPRQKRLNLQLQEKLIRVGQWNRKWGTRLRIWSQSSSRARFIIIRKCRNVKDLPQTKITNPRKWVSTSRLIATMLGNRAKG